MMSRKRMLQYKASGYGDRNQGVPQHLAGSRGYEAGYRAAMKGMRKIVRDARRRAMAVGVKDPFKRSQLRDLEQRIAVDAWLRPLR